MKRIFIAGLIVTGISLVVAALGAWMAPDLLSDLPGREVALFAAVFLAISGLFGGKLTEWGDTVFGKKTDERPAATSNSIEQQANIDSMFGGVITREYHHHEAPGPQTENHDTIGFIPAA